jgi:hypothetical protein
MAGSPHGLIEVVNITTRTSYYESFYYGRYGLYT